MKENIPKLQKSSSRFHLKDYDKCVQSTLFQQYILNKCINLAQKSCLTHKHGCVLVRNGEIISTGYNYKNDKLNNKNNYSVHAEICAMKKVKKNILSECELYVIRLGSTTNNENKCIYIDDYNNKCHIVNKEIMYDMKYSYPCESCQKVINSCKIKKVYYSINV